MGKVGNVIVGQSGGPTSVINSSLAGVFAMAKKLGCEKVYGMRHGIQGLLDDWIIDMSEYVKNDMDIELLKRTPSSYLGSCRFKLPAVEKGNESFEKIFQILMKYDIKFFFYIGGNDSMDTISKLQDYGKTIGSDIRFMGVPKTIDNDLALTDHTPGFGSVAKYVSTMMKEVILDSAVYCRQKIVTVVEVMGRNAGWLTGATALAKGEDCEGVDLIYLPELPFSVEKCIEDTEKLFKEKDSVVIAISEGVTDANGESISAAVANSSKVDAFGHKALTGTGHFLAEEIGRRLGCKTRPIELSSLQRCGSHMASATDIEEAFQVGGAAVKAALEGKSGYMVILKRLSTDPYKCVTDIKDIHEIANVEKKVPREWINEEGNGVTQEFVDYCRPLIQGEVLPVMINGLPLHIVLPKDV